MAGSKVLVLGYGEMGHAMQYLLQDSHEVFIWEKFPAAGFTSVQLEQVAPVADFVLFCLPVNPHRKVAEQLAGLLPSQAVCVSIAKGLDEAGQCAADILQTTLATHQPYALLYGPMISEELRAGRPGFAQLAGSTPAATRQVRTLFNNTDLYVQTTEDIQGISWAVILKNVYAILFGIADELGLGDNMRGFLAVTCLQELERIVIAMGGRPGTVYDLAGLGDLITTATSENSHHHTLGRRLARGETSDIKGEGVHTLDMVVKHRLFDLTPYPWFTLVQQAVQSPHTIASTFSQTVQAWFD